MKILDMLLTVVGVLLVSKVVELMNNIELNCWMKRRVKERLPLLPSASVSRHENADTFPILICRDSRYGQTGATCCDRKSPTAHSISFLVGFIKDYGFRRIMRKCDDEPRTKSFQDTLTQACVGVEVVPQGHPR